MHQSCLALESNVCRQRIGSVPSCPLLTTSCRARRETLPGATPPATVSTVQVGRCGMQGVPSGPLAPADGSLFSLPWIHAPYAGIFLLLQFRYGVDFVPAEATNAPGRGIMNVLQRRVELATR